MTEQQCNVLSNTINDATQLIMRLWEHYDDMGGDEQRQSINEQYFAMMEQFEKLHEAFPVEPFTKGGDAID